MMALVLMLFSLPLGLFLAWFAWRAHQVGRRQAARSMGTLAAGLLLAGGALGLWLAAALRSG
ncbi:MAG: hypothetical protein R8K47_04300 [Mariprofundaceae bacterium]